MKEDAGVRGSPRSFKNIITQLFRQKQPPSPLAQQAAAVDGTGGVLCPDSSVSSQQGPWSQQCTAGRRSTDSDAVQPADGCTSVNFTWDGSVAQGVPRQQAITPSSSPALPITDLLSVPRGTQIKGYGPRADVVGSVTTISSSLARRTGTSASDLPGSPCTRARRGLARGPDGQVLASVDEVYAQLMDEGPCCPSPAASTPAALAAAGGNLQGVPGHGASLLSRTSTANSTVSTVCLGRQLSIPLSDAVPSPQYLHNWDDLAMPGLAKIRTHRASGLSDNSSSNMNADDSATCSSISDWQLHGGGAAAAAAGALGPPGAAASPAAAAAAAGVSLQQYPCSTTASSSTSRGGAGPSPVLARHKSMPRLRSLGPSSSLLTPPARSSCSLTSSGSGLGLAGIGMSSTPGSYSSTAGGGGLGGLVPSAAAGGSGAAAGVPISSAHRALFPTAALPAAFSRLQPSTSAPGTPTAASLAAAGGGGGAGDPTAAAGGLARAQEDIREINQDNILSIQFGPQGAKLLSFKYCAATSPLSQPGRSPFASPRAPREPSEFFTSAAAGSPAPGRFSASAGCSSHHLHPAQQQQASSSIPLSRAVSCNSPGGACVVGTPPRGTTLRWPSGGVRSAVSSPAPGAGGVAAAAGAAQYGGAIVGAGALGVAAFFSPTELTQAAQRAAQQQDPAAVRLGSTSGRLDSVSSLGDLPENRVYQGQLAPVVVRRQRRSSMDAGNQAAGAPPPPPTVTAAAAGGAGGAGGGVTSDQAAAAGVAGTGAGGDAGAWLSGCQQGGSMADGASTSSSRCASLEPSSMWGSMAAASRRESLIEPAAVALGAARSASVGVLLEGGCVGGDTVSPGGVTGSPPGLHPGGGDGQHQASPGTAGGDTPASVLASSSCSAGGGGGVLGMCVEPAAGNNGMPGSSSSGSSYRGSCYPGGACLPGASYSSTTPTTTASSSCTPFSPLHPSVLAASGDAGTFCQSDQTQAAVQQSYLALQQGVWGHLPPPSRELESPGSLSLSGDESPGGKRRAGRVAAGAAGAAAAGGAGGSSCGAGVGAIGGGTGSHLSRLSQNSMPAAGFLTSRTSSSCTGVEAALALPELPEVDFIERIGKGCFGEVYKGIWNDSVVAVKVISAKRTLHPGDAGDLEQQLSMELARHEYESWINANLRHPNIMQLFTSFTVCLDGTSSGSSSSTEAAGRDLQPRQLQQQQQQQQLGSALSGTSPDASGLAPAGSTPAAASASSSARSDADAAMPAGVVSTGVAGASDVAAAAVAASTSYKWKTHLVMEYCDMGTLQAAIQCGWFRSPGGAARLDAVLATSKELAAAVAYLHSMDVVHGDLKGTNVLLKGSAVTRHDARGFVAKVADFGLSRVMDVMGETLPLEQQGFGALTHAAPELLSGQPLCAACDVFSVGVLLWELLVGQAAFAGVHPGEVLSLKLHHDPSDLLPFPLGTPPALVLLAQSCCAQDPSQRPPMTSVVSQLNAIALDLLGVEWCLGMFPDVARLVSSRRCQAAASLASSLGAGYASW